MDVDGIKVDCWMTEGQELAAAGNSVARWGERWSSEWERCLLLCDTGKMADVKRLDVCP